MAGQLSRPITSVPVNAELGWWNSPVKCLFAFAVNARSGAQPRPNHIKWTKDTNEFSFSHMEQIAFVEPPSGLGLATSTTIWNEPPQPESVGRALWEHPLSV